MLTSAKLGDGTVCPTGQAYAINLKFEGILGTGGDPEVFVRAPGRFLLQKVIGTLFAAADQDVIVDILVNGVTVFPVAANRLTIPALGFVGETSVILPGAAARIIEDGDTIFPNIVQVGTFGSEGIGLDVQLIGNLS